MAYYQNGNTAGSYGRVGMNMGGMLDIGGNPIRAGSSQIFAGSLVPGAAAGMTGGDASASASTSGLPGAGGSGIPTIQAPNLTPFSYSADSQSYPTYMRNLGENAAQQAFQRATNRISSGNSQQNLMHAQDDLNNNRLNYMSQAGQQDLTVNNALADNWNKYNSLLAQLYGTQVTQRGQDVGYAGTIGAASLRASEGGPSISMGGSRSPLARSQGSGGGGTYTSLQDTQTKDFGSGLQNFYNSGFPSF